MFSSIEYGIANLGSEIANLYLNMCLEIHAGFE